MRPSLIAALVVVTLAAALVSRSVSAEPPPPMERRALAMIIPALKNKADLAAVRYASEVFGITELQAPIGSSLDVLGPWGENGALLMAEQSMGTCAPLTGAQLKASSALLAEFPSALSPLLRAHALGQSGKTAEAADAFADFIKTQEPPGLGCPGEHPMYSHRRISRMNAALGCLQRLAPKRDLSKEKKAIDRAESCAKNNHAVG